MGWPHVPPLRHAVDLLARGWCASVENHIPRGTHGVKRHGLLQDRDYRRLGVPLSLLRAFGHHRRIPDKLRPRVRLEQIDAAARLAPFSALASAITVLIVEGTAWHQGPRLYMTTLVMVVEAIAAVIVLACWRWHQIRLVGGDVSHAVTFGRTSAALLGLVWASMPIALFPGAGGNERLLIAGTVTGLICTGIVISPLVSAAFGFVCPLILGCFIALYLTGEGFFVTIAMLLATYTIFIVASLAYLHSAFMERLLQQLQLEEQGEIIRLLLCDFDQSASDWLWETDANGFLRNVSQRCAQVLQGRPAELEGASFFEAIFREAEPAAGQHADRQRLAYCVAERVFFRDVVVPVRVGAEDRCWSLTGKPMFDDAGTFRGYRGVGSDVTAIRAQEARAAHQARHDFLTGLPNRLSLLEALRCACESAATRPKPFAVLLLDLDRFKGVNDRLGHAAGDQVLRAVASRLSGTVRHDDLIARFGGDEFIILQSDATADTAATLAQRVIDKLSSPFSIDEAQASIGVSVGIALAPSAGESPEDLLRGADLALYEAKASERGTYRFFERELESSAQKRRSLLADLRQALTRGELSLAYQPIVSAQAAAVRCFEALLRWEHPERGLIPTGQLIALAEEAGLLSEIGEWTLRLACKEATSWPTPLRVSVNVSAAQVRDQDLVALVGRALQDGGLAANRLELEITESAFVEASAPVLETLHSLQASGVRIALDDFGTGFSALGYLRSLPFNKIKIDGSFIRDMSTDRHCAAIVHAVIGLAASLGVATTAEGVETIEQFLVLRAQGCTEAQGFLFSPPLPPSEITSFLQTARQLRFPGSMRTEWSAGSRVPRDESELEENAIT
jgi:diguanylate cyclase (GGDEF)-like protein